MRGLVLLVALLLAAPASAADWPTVVKTLGKKVVRIEILESDADRPSICSGVIVNAASGFVVTAAHCVANDGMKRQDITVRGEDAAVARYNRLLDIAVLRIEPKLGDEQITLADETPAVGTEIAVVGHAFGYRQQVVTFGHMALVLDDDDEQMRVDAMSVPGMSGGALIDAQGRLAGMVSGIWYIGPAHLSAMVTPQQLKQYLGAYLPKP